MRKKQTFLLTVLSSDADDASFCGKVKVISSGKSINFSNMGELFDLIAFELGNNSFTGKGLKQPQSKGGCQVT